MDMSALSDCIISLEKSADILSDFMGSISEDELKVKRRPGFWSIRHHLFHLAETQDLLYKRLVRFKEEERPVITPYFPSEDKESKAFTSAEEALSVFMALRKKQVELIRSYDESDLRKEGLHPEYRQYNIPILVRHILMHDYWHMYRMEEVWLTTDEYLEKE
ncbi:MAG TPA: DinB family protein [Spirochaetota bacterium]|nr:DinB family protein [Spirochaetota bacterium]